MALPDPALHTAPAAVPPILVEARRGDMVESRHRGSVAVVDTAGRMVESHGNPVAPVFPRSAIKFLQALPLLESGAADAFAVTPPELALACASHGGETRHVEAVLAWLARLGLSVDDLECGPHWPSTVAATHALVRAGETPRAVHNNCSGKHTGMLATCRHLGEPTRGYIDPAHPAQRRILGVFEAMCGVDLARAPRGTDGCSLPQLGMPLTALARGIARFGAPDGLPPARAAACRRLAAAVVAHPFMLAGTDRACTRLNEIAAGKAVVKTGAEGVYVAAIPAKGLGIALKIEDGAGRAAEIAIAHLLARHADLTEAQRSALAPLLASPTTNAAGRIVGGFGPAPTW